MRMWDKVSINQRVLDAAEGYRFLAEREFIDNKSIGLIGWSLGGTMALAVQRVSKRLQLPNGGFKGTATQRWIQGNDCVVPQFSPCAGT